MNKQNKHKFSCWLTLGPIGYLQGRGTWASFITVLISTCFDLRYSIFSSVSFLSFTVFLMTISYFLMMRAVAYDKVSDPQEIVIDEVIGMLCSLIGSSGMFVDLVLRFLFFRFFDITKLGINWAERIPGAAGIMIDDIAAAGIAQFCMLLVAWI